MKIADHDLGRLALARELTLQDIAARLDIPPSTLSAIGHRRLRPRARTVARLAELLGVELGEVLAATLEPLPEVARRRPRRNKRMPIIDFEEWLSRPESPSHAKGVGILRALAADVTAEMQRREAVARAAREQEQRTGSAPVGANPEHSEVTA